MNNDELKNIIFSKNVIEFLTVAVEFCGFIENATAHEKNDFIDKTLKISSLLYLKTIMLPPVESTNEEENEKFVSEFDYNLVRNNINLILGDDDIYLDFFDANMIETPEPVAVSISENYADIYQELKDFVSLYQLNDEIIMTNALAECNQQFINHWGHKLTSSIRMLHYLLFIAPDNYNKKDPTKIAKKDTSDFFSKIQRNYQDNA